MKRLVRDLKLAALIGRDVSHVIGYVVKDRAYHTALWAKRRLT